jgi:Rieske Fe-S protein
LIECRVDGGHLHAPELQAGRGGGQNFLLPCHGSTFDPDGKVTEEPARRNLPGFEISANEKGDLLAKIPL